MFNVRKIHIFSGEEELEESKFDVSALLKVKNNWIPTTGSVSKGNGPFRAKQWIYVVLAGGS